MYGVKRNGEPPKIRIDPKDRTRNQKVGLLAVSATINIGENAMVNAVTAIGRKIKARSPILDPFPLTKALPGVSKTNSLGFGVS